MDQSSARGQASDDDPTTEPLTVVQASTPTTPAPPSDELPPPVFTYSSQPATTTDNAAAVDATPVRTPSYPPPPPPVRWETPPAPAAQPAQHTDHFAERPTSAPSKRFPWKPIALVAAVLVAAAVALGVYGYQTHAESQRSTDFANALEILDVIPVGGAPHGVAVDSGAQVAYVANQADGTVSVIDSSTRKEVATIPVADGAGNVGLDPQAHALFVGTQSGIAVVDTNTRVVVGTIPTRGDFVVDPDTHTIWIYTWEGASTQVLDTRTRQTRFTLSHNPYAGGVVVDSASGRAYLATGNQEPYVMWVFDATNGNLLDQFPVTDVGWGLTLGGPDVLYSAGGGSYDVHVTNLADKTSDEIPGRNRMWKIAYDTNAGLIYATSVYDNEISVIDPAKKMVLRQIETNNPEDIAVDSERNLVYVTNNKASTLTIIGPP